MLAAAIAPLGALPADASAAPAGAARRTAPSRTLSAPSAHRARRAATLPVRLTFVTTWVPGDRAPIRRVTHGNALGQTGIDVGGSTAPELVANVGLRPDGEFAVTVRKAPGAPARLPVAVTGTVTLNASPAESTTLGYDATATTAPGQFTAVIGLGASGVDTKLSFRRAPAQLTVVAGRREPSSAKSVRLRLDPVPRAVRIRGSVTQRGGTIELARSDATAAAFAYRADSGAERTEVRGALSLLPPAARIELDGEAGASRLRYRAAGDVPAARFSLTERHGDEVRGRLELGLAQVPRAVDFAQSSARTDLSASAPIGLIAGSVGPQPPPSLDAPAFVRRVARGGADSTAIRLPGVRSAHLSLTAPLTVEAELRSARLLAMVDAGPLHVDAVIRDVPDRLSLAFSPDGPSLNYHGSAPIADLALRAANPGGLAGDVAAADLHLRAVPTGLDLRMQARGRRLLLDTGGDRLGQLELGLNADVGAILAPGHDGIVVRDDRGSFAAGARITGLRRAVLDDTPSPALAVDATGRRPFDLSLHRAAGSEPAMSIQGTLARLSPDTRLGLGADARVVYSAAEPAGSLSLRADDVPGLPDRVRHVALRLSRAPRFLALASDGTTFGVDTHGEGIGTLEAALSSSSNGPQVPAPDGSDGVILRDTPAAFVAIARVTGLRGLALAQGPNPSLALDGDGGRPFRLDAEQGAGSARRTFAGEISQLPRSARVRVEGGTFSYRATERIRAVSFAGRNLDGLPGRARDVDLAIEGVPHALTVTAAGGAFDLDAHNEEAALVDAQLTSGPPATIDPGADGLVFRDLPDAWTAHVRIHGLRRVRARRDPLALSLEAHSGRPVALDVATGAWGLDGEISSLPGSEELRATPNGIVHTASAPIAELTIAARNASALLPYATISAVGVPARLSVTAGEGGTFAVDAPAGAIGQVTVGTAPDAARLLDARQELQPAEDGLIVRATPGAVRALVRVTGLRRASFSPSGPAVVVDALGRRPARIDTRWTENPRRSDLSGSLDLRPWLTAPFAGGSRPLAIDVHALAGTFDRLPPDAEAGISSGRFAYRAAAAAGEVSLHGRNLGQLPGKARHLDLSLESVPRSVIVDAGSDSYGLSAGGGAIGHASVELTDGSAAPLAGDGVRFHDDLRGWNAAASVTGLRALRVALSRAPDIQVDAASRSPLAIDVAPPALRTLRPGAAGTITGTISGLAPRTHVHYAPQRPARTGGGGGGRGGLLPEHRAQAAADDCTILYEAAGRVGAVDLVADGLAVLPRIAPHAELHLADVPARICVSPSASGMSLGTGGGTIGSLVAELSGGPAPDLPANADGFVVRSAPDVPFAIKARLTALRGAALSLDRGAVSAWIDSRGQRQLRVDARTYGQIECGQPGERAQDVRLVLDSLQPDTRLSADPGWCSATRVSYSAASPAKGLSFFTDGGRRQSLTVQAAPLPAALTLCASDSGTCAAGAPATAKSYALRASEPIRISLRDCQACPRTGTAQQLALDVAARSLTSWLSLGSNGGVYLDTLNSPSAVRIRDTRSRHEPLDLTLPPGFRAARRLVGWRTLNAGGFPIVSPLLRGTINCPPGTHLLAAPDGPGNTAPFLSQKLLDQVATALCWGGTSRVSHETRSPM